MSDPAVLARVYGALCAKYGWRMWLTDVLSRLTGRHHRRTIIEITLHPA